MSGERIWEKSDGQNLANRHRYPLFITITCDFSRFDNPYRPTAGEYTYWNPKGGAISMITTVRSIDQTNAEIFTKSKKGNSWEMLSVSFATKKLSSRRAVGNKENSSTN